MQNFQKAIDIDALLTYCRGDEVMAYKLIDAYLKTQSQYLQDAELSVSDRDTDTTRAMCHKLIGAAKTLRAKKIVPAIDELRAYAIDGDWEKADNAMTRIKIEFDTISELKQKNQVNRIMNQRNYKLLIIDDDEFILTSLQLAFENTPYQVTTVNDPLKAIDLIENEPFAIVISDIVMPGMDGLQLLKRIKQYNGMIQVVMLTSEITVNNTITAFRYGAVDIFFKPLEDMQEIIKAVDDAALKLDRVNSILKKVCTRNRG